MFNYLNLIESSDLNFNEKKACLFFIKNLNIFDYKFYFLRNYNKTIKFYNKKIKDIVIKQILTQDIKTKYYFFENESLNNKLHSLLNSNNYSQFEIINKNTYDDSNKNISDNNSDQEENLISDNNSDQEEENLISDNNSDQEEEEEENLIYEDSQQEDNIEEKTCIKLNKKLIQNLTKQINIDRDNFMKNIHDKIDIENIINNPDIKYRLNNKIDKIFNNKKTNNIKIYNLNITNEKYKKLISRIEYKINKYSNFFHKTILDIEHEIKYDILYENKSNYFINNRFFIHLHCFDLNKFDLFYGEYINNIKEYFSIIITFSNINEKTIKLDYFKHYTLIKIPNVGMDIGAKLIVIYYLNKNNINYRNILFLHSKTNNDKRKKYFSFFIGNKKQINYICNIASKYDAIFPNLICNGDWEKGFYFFNKKCYYEFNKIYGLTHLTDKFIEGNVLMLSRKFINEIFFHENIIKLFYSNLNSLNSFDLNWFTLYYKINNMNIYETYKYYILKKLYGNCLQTSHLPVITNYKDVLNRNLLHNLYLPDANIEHVYERLWLNICYNYNFDYIIVDYYQDYTYEMIDFDINIYKLLNKKESFHANLTNIYNLQNQIIQSKQKIIFSLKQILKKLPLDFNINHYAFNHNLIKHNKYEIINHYISNHTNVKNTYFENINKTNDIFTFIILFPQFYETNINNKVWGDGFTEWDNLKKTYLVNNFHNNLHPHPDIGYYNLLELKHLKRIINYCNDYCMNGFMIYHYWFNNNPIMSGVIKQLIKYKLLTKKKWFFSWVNEHWIKKWDILEETNVKDNEIICKQYYNIKDIHLHYKYLHKYFKLDNYYKPNNKPWFVIYRGNNVPSEYLNKLNSLALLNGFNGITFIRTLNNNQKNIENFINNDINHTLYDYEFEFTPNCYSKKFSCKQLEYNNSNSKINLINNISYINDAENVNCLKYNIQDIYKHISKQKNTNKIRNKNKKLIKGIFTGWDNLSRYSSLKKQATIFFHSNSFDFFLICIKQFLQLKRENNDKKYHIINSLNEWCEQAVLEPSIEMNYSFLIAYKYAKKIDLEKVNEKLIDKLICF